MMEDTRKHLFLIEDVVDHAEVMRAMLGDTFQVTHHSSCADAVVALQRLRPDIFLIDIGLKDLDGVECLRQIRQITGLNKTPAIAVTAFAYPQDKERCMNAGFQDFVAKPVLDYDHLIGLIRRTLGQRNSPED